MRAVFADAPKPATTPTVNFDKDIHPLITTYCANCHNPDKQKGDLDLTQFTTPAKAAAAKDTWSSIAERLDSGEMPPPKSKQPSEAERARLLAWIGTFAPTELDCSDAARDKAMRQSRGGVMSRRLNRAEYNHTIHDLIDLDLKA